MRVVSMALIETSYYVLFVTSMALALASQWMIGLVYLNAIILFVMLYLQIAAIPLNLNWSRNLCGRLLRRMCGFVLFSVVIYATHYHFGGITRDGERVESFVEAVYFSFTTWTTLGYGDVTAVAPLRLATSLEALSGLLTTAVLTAFLWLYCSERLWSRSMDSPEERPLRLEGVLGGFREVESPEVAEETAERQRRLRLNPCRRCAAVPKTEKFYDIYGRLAPFANFVVMCSCGEHAKYSKNAYLAVHRWNRRHRPGTAGKDAV